MTRDPSAPSRARRAEQKANPISIKPLSSTNNKAAGGGGFKKGGFKNAFGGDEEGEEGKVVVVVGEEKGKVDEGVGEGEGEKGSGSEDDGEERYDPRRPTGCWSGCEGWRGG